MRTHTHTPPSPQIIVDDCSTDKSIEVSLGYAAEHGISDKVKVVSIKPNRGKGYVVKQVCAELTPPSPLPPPPHPHTHNKKRECLRAAAT